MTEQSGENAPDTGGLAMDLAMEEARNDPSLRGHVAAFLDDQRALVADQRHHLREQFKQLRLGTWEKRFGVMLRAATAVVGVAVAGALGLVVWDAAHSEGVVVESFSVPPDLAARGLTGQAVASQVLDRLAQLQTASLTVRAPKSFTNNWGDNLRVEIPQTGISLGEAHRFLRGWLGHETRVSGEIIHTETGLSIIARAEGAAASTVTGPAGDPGTLIRAATDHVYGATQPYRYGYYLFGQRRIDEAAAVYRPLITGPDRLERAWALNGMGRVHHATGAVPQSRDAFRAAIAIKDDLVAAHTNLATMERGLGRPQAALQGWRNALQRLGGSGAATMDPREVPIVTALANAMVADLQGDFSGAEAFYRRAVDLPDIADYRDGSYLNVGLVLALQHDTPAAEAWWRNTPPIRGVGYGYYKLWVRARLDMARQDWKAALASVAALRKAVAQTGFRSLWVDVTDQPRHAAALAHAKLGDFAAAEREIAPTPAACHDCVLVRAQIAALRGQDARADFWFARASSDALSIPFADHEWGRALLARGKPDAAIQKFTSANQKGPKFADPLEGWGEALMAKNQSHLAVEKFAEAEKYAPNWKRLHLKWAEALTYAGKRDEAAKHFSKARAL